MLNIYILVLVLVCVVNRDVCNLCNALTVPLEVPGNFSIVNGSVNATSAVFTWHEVDTSFDKIRGFFRGYQVQSRALTFLSLF